MRKTTSGFTIVELLIVIVVIGILAAIVIVSYSGAQKRAQNTARIEELKAWQKSLVQYKAANNGQYPTIAEGGYCLGTGFPSGKCRDYASGDPLTSYSESNSTALMSALSSYDPPKITTHIPVNGTVGPYIDYFNNALYLTAALNGSSSDCVSGTVYAWTDSAGRVLCRITLPRP